MLEGNLYRLVSLDTADDVTSAVVALNPSSVIYRAHFRGMPITPGVCLVQIAVELASKASGRALSLTGAKDIKFLQPVLPGELSEITYTLMPSTTWQVVVTGGDTVRAKMTLTLI